MSYDHLARPYAWIERGVFGGALQRARTCLIPDLPPVRDALLIGEGDGRFLEAFLAARPDTRVTVLDASAGMLARSAARVEGSPRVRFVQADAREAELADSSFDLVVSHFFFDGFEEADQALLATRLARACRARASWLVAEFLPPSPGLLRGLRARLWLSSMYAFFGLATEIETRRLADFRPALRATGFARVRRESGCRGLASAELWVRNCDAGLC